MNNKNKGNENPAKKVKPTQLPVKEVRDDGKQYRYTLKKEKER